MTAIHIFRFKKKTHIECYNNTRQRIKLFPAVVVMKSSIISTAREDSTNAHTRAGLGLVNLRIRFYVKRFLFVLVTFTYAAPCSHLISKNETK